MADTLQILMIGVVFFLMLGLGSTVRISDLTAIKSNPKGPIIGFISQFLLMPLCAFALAKAVNVTDEQGLSMVLIGCTPGGSTSNLFTYFSRGDLPLSIAMTVISNAAAFFMMPLLLLIYSPAFTGDDIEIPYAQIFLGLLVVLFPVAIGMVILAKKPDVAAKLEKFASVLGALFILAAIVAGCLQNKDLFTSGWKLWFCSIVMLPFAASFGYGLSTLAKLPKKQRRTIALETGIQNTTLTIAIIILSYPTSDTDPSKEELQKDVLAFPLMFSLFLVLSACVISFIFNKISVGEIEEEGDEKKKGAEGEEFFDSIEKHEVDPSNNL
ncbi:hypothetical protein TrCOL_g10288 [Triparma columacea]|uniref:Uncharacterized protein n=1 Tax=Triparma columacea TaxID=722753 RepID=A0A9W7GJE7_9STRA|nr:hypothetical protein TrCOL_g10288 [Triparma columacea]